MKRLSLELGGHAPFIVFPDADSRRSAKAAVIGKFRNNGQVCIAPSRFYVHEKVAKNFTEAAVELTKKLKLGNGLEEGVQVGPMFEKQALDKTAGADRGRPRQGRQDPDRRRPLDPLREGLLLRADRDPRGRRRDADHDRGAVRPGDAAARLHASSTT